MKSDISEFSYGYALTSEIVQKVAGVLAGAPVFPSLYQEGALGYDLELPLLGAPLFLQFKLSDYMVRSTAEGADKVPTPHYRMNLRPLKHSDQHQLLLDLNSNGHDVFYAAPEFHTARDLSDAYVNRNVIAQTAFWRPEDIGVLPDQDEHFVCFAVGASHGYLCSEPKRVERSTSEVVLAAGSGSSAGADETRRPRTGDLRLIGDRLVEQWMQRRGRSDEINGLFRKIRDTRDPLQYLGWVSQSLFDCVAIVRPARRQVPAKESNSSDS